MELPIGTAQGPKAMTSKGVGSLQLYTPGGSSIPGFDRVVFSEQTAARLASVGAICDENMVCIFDRFGLRIYKSDEIKRILEPGSTRFLCAVVVALLPLRGKHFLLLFRTFLAKPCLPRPVMAFHTWTSITEMPDNACTKQP